MRVSSITSMRNNIRRMKKFMILLILICVLNNILLHNQIDDSTTTKTKMMMSFQIISWDFYNNYVYNSTETTVKTNNGGGGYAYVSLGSNSSTSIAGIGTSDTGIGTTIMKNANTNHHNDNHPNDYNATEYKQLVIKSMDPLSSNNVHNSRSKSNGVGVVPTSTGAWIYGFWGGFCNQYFLFLGIVFLSNDLPPIPGAATSSQHPSQMSNQIYIHSLLWKDLYGTEQKLRHEILFDVHHWNAYYPKLPKLVSHYYYYIPKTDDNRSSSSGGGGGGVYRYDYFTDVYIHYDERGSHETVMATKENMDSKLGVAPRMIWNATTVITTTTMKHQNPTKRMDNATNPYPIGYKKSTEVANNRYKQFAKRLYRYHHHQQQQHPKQNDDNEQNYNDFEFEQYKSIMKDALRPHPELQSIIHDFQSSIPNKYIVLHSRIEPDMQKHPMCLSKKVTNVTHIIESLYKQFPNPPSSTLILLLNKDLLEKEVKDENNNPMAVYNLNVVNEIFKNGLWNGYTQVIEAGSKLALESKHEIYSKYPTLVGGIINFFLSLDAHVFIGTEVSSYSTSVVNSRFYRNENVDGTSATEGTRLGDTGSTRRVTKGEKINYFYTPEGLHKKDSIHWFNC